MFQRLLLRGLWPILLANYRLDPRLSDSTTMSLATIRLYKDQGVYGDILTYTEPQARHPSLHRDLPTAPVTHERVVLMNGSIDGEQARHSMS